MPAAYYVRLFSRHDSIPDAWLDPGENIVDEPAQHADRDSAQYQADQYNFISEGYIAVVVCY